MTQEELSEIEVEIKFKIRKIAGNTGFGYLNCNSSQWKDGGDYVHTLSRMDTTYLKRCLRTVKDANHFIDLHFDSVNEIIKIDHASNLTLDDKEKILDITKKYLHDLHDKKIKEIESELSSR